jgi:hypothetical protein
MPDNLGGLTPKISAFSSPPADESLDRHESDHVESPGHVERDLPKDDVSRR